MRLKEFFSRDNPVRVALRVRRLGRKLIQWEENGRPAPPPDIVKRGLIKAYAKRFGCEYFVETGTYFGETVQFVLDTFNKIWSVELAPQLASAAQKRFAPHGHVQIIQGDSGQVLKQIMPQWDRSTLFWLDGHWNHDEVTARGDTVCPVLAELDAVFSGHPERDVILIDDARIFSGQGDYPSMTQLRDYVAARLKQHQFYVADDVIRIHRLD